MTYVLLFPCGEKGWCPDLKISPDLGIPLDQKGSKFDACEFYSQRVMVYSAEKSALPHAGGRLLQQYVVDVFAKVEGMRLDWYRRSQDKLRMDSLQGLMDHISGSANDELSPPPGADVLSAAAEAGNAASAC